MTHTSLVVVVWSCGVRLEVAREMGCLPTLTRGFGVGSEVLPLASVAISCGILIEKLCHSVSLLVGEPYFGHEDVLI